VARPIWTESITFGLVSVSVAMYTDRVKDLIKAKKAGKEVTPGGAGRSDALQIEQSTAGAGDEFGQFPLRDLDLLVDDDEFVDEFQREPAAGLTDHVARSDGGERGAGLLPGQVLLGAAGNEFEQQVVRSGDEFGAVAAELLTTVDQQPQRDRGVIGAHTSQVRGAQGDQGDAAGVDRVGLAALAGGEDPGSGGELGGHVYDGFAVGDKALRDVPAISCGR
jgi:hypothetical protein